MESEAKALILRLSGSDHSEPDLTGRLLLSKRIVRGWISGVLVSASGYSKTMPTALLNSPSAIY